MRIGEPSQTARGTAAYRAIHQTHEGGAIFRDSFAVKILDDEIRAALDQIVADPAQRLMRLFITARSRFSEDALAAGAGPEPVVCAAGGSNLLADAWASRKQGLYMVCNCLPRRKIMCGVSPPRCEIQRFTAAGYIEYSIWVASGLVMARPSAPKSQAA